MKAFLRRVALSVNPRPSTTTTSRRLDTRHTTNIWPFKPPLSHRVLPKFWPRPSLIPNMERVNVRCVDQEETMTITLVYEDMNLCLQRNKSEQLERSLARLCASVLKKSKLISKRSNKKLKADNKCSNDLQKLVSVSLKNSLGTDIDVSMSNIDAWQNGSILNIGSSNYCIHRNSPSITKLSLPRCAVVGCPILPRVSLEFTSKVQYVWYRGVPVNGSGSSKSDSEELKKKRSGDVSEKCDEDLSENTITADLWEQVCTEKVYTPVPKDEGYLLKLECTPLSGSTNGIPVNCVLESTVRSFSNSFPFEKRHKFTSKLTIPNSLRVVSYNILADVYADSDFSRDVLYPYCPPDILHIDYREQLILKEITGYNADIICLQETGKRLYENSLVPSLNTTGLEGLICYKKGQSEGEAIFYRKSKLRFVANHDLVLSNAFETNSLYSDLLERVSSNEAMLKRVASRSSIVQVVVFEDVEKPSRKLCVVNTHLYFHPRAGHVRLIQTAVITRHVEHLKNHYRQQHGCENLAVIFCCDLNSTPGTGAFDLLSTGSVAKYAADWYSSGKEEFCGGMAISHSLKLDRAYKSALYTNYVSGFQGVLDYIFFENHYLDMKLEVALPEHSDVVQFTALPSQVFPSDHLALVCDLKWKN